MPRGISSRSTAPVVLMSVLMPLLSGCAQAPFRPAAPQKLTVADSSDGFVIRSARQPRHEAPGVKLGASVHLDRALVQRRTGSTNITNTGEKHEVR